MKSKIILVISIIFGLMFINAGLNKFLNYMPTPNDLPEGMIKLMLSFMQIGWLMPLIAVVEIVGGILFIFTRTRALGAIILLPIMAGILLTHAINAPSGIPLALILFVINLWVIFENREKYMPMIR